MKRRTLRHLLGVSVIMAFLLSTGAFGCGLLTPEVIVVTATPAPEEVPPEEVPPEEVPGVEAFLWVEREEMEPGECTALMWEVVPPDAVERVFVYAAGAPEGREERDHVGQLEICPNTTTTYILEAHTVAGLIERSVTVYVAGAPEEVPPEERPPGEVQITFIADRTNLQPGECATLEWSVQGDYPVELDDPRGVRWQPVDRSGQTQVCPPETTPYSLCVLSGDPPECREVVIVVAGAAPPPPPAAPTATSPPPPAAPTATSPPPPPPPPPTTPTPWTTDLAVTDLYPDKLKGGTVYGRITNHGPGTCKNVEIQFSCSWAKTAYGATFGLNEKMGPKKITITSLNPGQTASFSTGIVVDITQFWYDMTCQIHVGFNDPNTANNSYKEKLAK